MLLVEHVMFVCLQVFRFLDKSALELWAAVLVTYYLLVFFEPRALPCFGRNAYIKTTPMPCFRLHVCSRRRVAWGGPRGWR